mgnify:FL=1
MTGKNRLPRLDLHCHLDGSLSQGCIEELLGRSVKLEELQADMDCQSLAEYLEKFEIPLECLQTEKGLERAGYDLMKSAASDQVDYIEARFAPLFSGQRGSCLQSRSLSLYCGEWSRARRNLTLIMV